MSHSFTHFLLHTSYINFPQLIFFDFLNNIIIDFGARDKHDDPIIIDPGSRPYLRLHSRMSDDFVARITKALDTGIKLARRISKSSNSPSSAQALQITETAQDLQRSLEGSFKAIGDAYKQSVESCGEPFNKALLEDQSIQARLKELRIELIDHINECQDFDEDEPDTFDPKHFSNLKLHSQKCADECVSMINRTRDQILQENLRNFKLSEKARDDRAQLSSMKQSRPAPQAPQFPVYLTSPMEVSRPNLSVQPPAAEPAMPKSPWAIDSPAGFSIGSPISPSQRTVQRHPSQDISPSSKIDDSQPRLIPKEIVNHRLSANEEFLERRRQSRIIFQKEFRKSVSSIEEKQVSQVTSDSPTLGLYSAAITLSTSAERKRASDLVSNGSIITSPILEDPNIPISPIDGRASRASGSGYDSLMTRQRSQGATSQASRASRSSSILQNPTQNLQRTGSQASQESIFGLRAAPLSPPISERGSGGDSWGALATTLQLPGFGMGVEPGLEVVSPVDHNNEKMLAYEDNMPEPTPTASMKSIDHPMRHDTSFYKFGGFCDGSKAILSGEAGLKKFKRPLGQFNTTTCGRCTKCAYEVSWNDVEKDLKLEKSGIYGNSGIRFRQMFLSKCHVKTSSVDEPFYACIFCIDDHKTVEEHDATVFFSVSSLFRHLAKHPQPVPNIPGLNIIYGNQPAHVVDFDIHFISSIPRLPEFSMLQIAQKVATRPSAYAITTHHPKNTRSTSRDPDGNQTLHFAAGARIVGITFPERFGGQWCVGYHDGERGSFPSSAIVLELPLREDVLMNAQSTLIAYAKWDFKPKDAKDGGWLKFSKGEKISAVGYTFQDQWCWSGQTSKGKWGLFPAMFVEGLQEVEKGRLGSSAGSVKSGGGLGLRIGSIPLGRKRSSRTPSVLGYDTSQLAGRAGNWQPGLEVVPGRATTGGWKP